MEKPGKDKELQVNTVALTFTGDIGFDKYMDKKWEDENLIDADVLGFLKNSDHLIINVEGPLLEQTTKTDSKGVASLVHSMDPAATAFFDKIGADVWNICNNHIMDAGPDGMAGTLEQAALHKVQTLGAGMNIDEAARPVIFPEAGGIGLIGVGYQRACRKATEDTPGCLSWSDMDIIQAKIDEVKSKCKWCVIVAHGGEEFTALPSPYVRDRYIEYLNMGADVVVSHHPHVPMNYETFNWDDAENRKIIFYSLGNFVFDTDYQRAQFNTEKGIVIKLKFTATEFDYEAKGIRIDRDEDHIVSGDLPKIFADVQEKEYRLLAPLAAKMFIDNTKRQWTFLKPDVFKNATEEDWYNNFYEPLRSGRVPGEVLDFQLVYPLAKEEAKKEWMKSKLEDVKQFMLEQLL